MSSVVSVLMERGPAALKGGRPGGDLGRKACLLLTCAGRSRLRQESVFSLSFPLALTSEFTPKYRKLRTSMWLQEGHGYPPRGRAAAAGLGRTSKSCQGSHKLRALSGWQEVV